MDVKTKPCPIALVGMRQKGPSEVTADEATDRAAGLGLRHFHSHSHNHAQSGKVASSHGFGGCKVDVRIKSCFRISFGLRLALMIGRCLLGAQQPMQVILISPKGCRGLFHYFNSLYYLLSRSGLHVTQFEKLARAKVDFIRPFGTSGFNMPTISKLTIPTRPTIYVICGGDHFGRLCRADSDYFWPYCGGYRNSPHRELGPGYFE